MTKRQYVAFRKRLEHMPMARAVAWAKLMTPRQRLAMSFFAVTQIPPPPCLEHRFRTWFDDFEVVLHHHAALALFRYLASFKRSAAAERAA